MHNRVDVSLVQIDCQDVVVHVADTLCVQVYIPCTLFNCASNVIITKSTVFLTCIWGIQGPAFSARVYEVTGKLTLKNA